MGRLEPDKVGLDPENPKKLEFFGNYLLLSGLNFENFHIDIPTLGGCNLLNTKPQLTKLESKIMYKL